MPDPKRRLGTAIAKWAAWAAPMLVCPAMPAKCTPIPASSATEKTSRTPSGPAAFMSLATTAPTAPTARAVRSPLASKIPSSVATVTGLAAFRRAIPMRSHRGSGCSTKPGLAPATACRYRMA